MQPWVEFPLTKGKVALVDVQDLLILAQFKWSATPTNGLWYAKRNYRLSGRCFGESMHRRIMEPSPGFVVDHINGDGLDNRRVNLRLATLTQNQANRTHRRSSLRWYIGVKPATASRGWTAQTRGGGRKTVHLGTFATAAEAARAYDSAVVAMHGEFATTNLTLSDERRAAIDAAAREYDDMRKGIR